MKVFIIYSYSKIRDEIEETICRRLIVILDCCYSGSLKIGKGSERDAAEKGRKTIEEESKKLSHAQGKFILYASQALQEAYALREEEQSIYTKSESIDNDGNLTPWPLHNFVDQKITSLPRRRRPEQRPGIQRYGNIILASFPDRRKPMGTPPTPVEKVKKKYLTLTIVGVAAVSM